MTIEGSITVTCDGSWCEEEDHAAETIVLRYHLLQYENYSTFLRDTCGWEERNGPNGLWYCPQCQRQQRDEDARKRLKEKDSE